MVTMTLIPPNQLHLLTIMGWFPDQEAITSWAGPNFRYPCTVQSFRQDLRLAELQSFVLVNAGNQLLAFGQYYKRMEKCHLGRLVINPLHRGKGLIGQLMQQLIDKGQAKLNLTSASLFVFKNNIPAISAYKKFGFKVTRYPKPIPIDDCLYMVR